MAPTMHKKKPREVIDSDDIWDDTLLIQAYDTAIKLHKEDVAKRLAMATNKRKENSESENADEEEPEDEFKVGSFVRSTFEDGVDYEAEILKIEDNGTCVIRYIGYNNEEHVKLVDLVPSWGAKTREQQNEQALIDKEFETYSEQEVEVETTEFHQFTVQNSSLPAPPLPPMPPGIFDGSEDADYLSAMMMSWYMSGYYTGLYHGRKQLQQTQQSTMGQKKRKSNRN
jgi:survival motor neuron protein